MGRRGKEKKKKTLGKVLGFPPYVVFFFFSFFFFGGGGEGGGDYYWGMKTWGSKNVLVWGKGM